MSHGGCLQIGHSWEGALQHGLSALQEVDLRKDIRQRCLIWHAGFAVQHCCTCASRLTRARMKSCKNPFSVVVA